MKMIDFSGSRCKHCYKCVRCCEVKAIDIRDSQAIIDENRCILCGQCLNICPQDAKTLYSELPAVKEMISSGATVVLSVAPSYLGLLSGVSAGQAVAACKRLGFAQVRETAEGAACVTEEYVRLLNQKKMDNIITTCCPSAVSLVEIYYPELIPYLAPVVSPMVAHGMRIRQELGSAVKVVFVGPCVAKKSEARDARFAGAIDAVLNFHELSQWLQEEGIRMEDCQPESFDGADAKINRLYPVTNGIVSSVMLTNHQTDSYRKFYVDGIKNCRELCESMKRGEIHGCFVEMNMCTGGCVKGPLIEEQTRSRFTLRLDYEQQVTWEPADMSASPSCDPAAQADSFGAIPSPDFSTTFTGHEPVSPLPTEEQIRELLARTGKKTPADELNCGACGYPTCREKAIAVFQGRAEVAMCIPYMHDQAASLSNLVLETSPNIVIIVNRDLDILEYSAIGERYFGKTKAEALKMKLSDFFDPSDFEEVLNNKRNIHGRKVSLPQYDLITLQNIVYLPSRDCALATIIDITASEREARKEYARKLETINMAQQVIDKQMTVAQQIAGLLGETTAETKVSLTQIGRILLDDGEDESYMPHYSYREGSDKEAQT